MAKQVPGYCLHKATGQAVVRLNGHDHYLGTFETDESRQKYDRLIAEWLANGRDLPERASRLLVCQLIERFLSQPHRPAQPDDDGPP